MTDVLPAQRALQTIRKLRLELERLARKEPIAIIGLSCRFPQAQDAQGFWRLLTAGRSAITRLPDERRRLLAGSEEQRLLRPEHPYWGGYLEDITLFDAQFFGITPREALYMDPQQRLLLEVAYEALADTGAPVARLAGSATGVYVGMYGSQYLSFVRPESELDALFVSTGSATSIAANRISYLLDLRGPSLTVDTACSSSLVALHLACLQLQAGSCDQAVVGGVSLNLRPSVNYLLAQAKMLSPDGRCKTFDAAANGYVQGEGVAAVVLKPLSRALQEGRRIYGVIAGVAVNQDGKSNGLTAPNGAQQEALLRAACAQAQIDPAQVGYVECHGTGTFLGDPIEAEAVGRVLGNRSPERPCWIGSVKTNIGHLEPAAGLAGLIKVCLALQHRQLPPHLHFSNPNPHIAFERFHLRVPTQLIDWPQSGEARVAGLSSFGFGGTNAHVLLRELTRPESQAAEQAPEQAAAPGPRRSWAHKSYWPLPRQSALDAEPGAEPATARPLHGRRLASPLAARQFQFHICHEDLPELTDTRGVLHVGYYLEMLSFAVRCLTGGPAFSVKELRFLAPIRVSPGSSATVHLIIQPSLASQAEGTEESLSSVEFYRAADGARESFSLCASCMLAGASPAQSRSEPAAAVRRRCQSGSGDAAAFKQRITAMHMPIGDSIRWTEEYWHSPDEILARLRPPSPNEGVERFSLGMPPGVIDGSIQPLFMLLDAEVRQPYITSRIEELRLFGPVEGQLYLAAQLHEGSGGAAPLIADFTLMSEDAKPVALCRRIELVPLGTSERFASYESAALDRAAVDRLDLSAYPPRERERRILHFVRQQAALLFQMPIDEVAVDRTLQDLGMDSLLATALNQRLEEGLGTAYPLIELLQPTTLLQIARRCCDLAGIPPAEAVTDVSASSASAQAQPSEVSAWMPYTVRKREREPALRLFCFPYGGAGASIYWSWQRLLPAAVEVCPIQLPGRESRLREKPILSLQRLVTEIAAALREELRPPYALFGHSFGALLAFELVRHLQHAGQTLPQHLFVSAFPAPHIRSANFQNLLQDLAPLGSEPERVDIAALSNSRLIEIARLLQKHHLFDADEQRMAPELLRVFLPTLFADSCLVANHRHAAGAPLPVPITALCGADDSWIDPASIPEWGKHTSRAFCVHEFKGGHLFLKEGQALAEMLWILARTLLRIA